MSGRLWLEQVQRELFRRKLPRQEVARLVAELSDHLADAMESRSAAGTTRVRGTANVSYSDLTEEHMSMEVNVAECLGSPAEIADTAVCEFRRRRHLRSRLAAFCTFVLLPLPALILAWSATIVAIAELADLAEWCGWNGHPERQITPLLVFVAHMLFTVIVLGPAAGVAALFGRLARKTDSHWRWGLTACLLVALSTAMVTTTATFSELPGKSTVAFGFPIAATGMNALKLLLRPVHLGQFLIPLATGILVLRRSVKGASAV